MKPLAGSDDFSLSLRGSVTTEAVSGRIDLGLNIFPLLKFKRGEGELCIKYPEPPYIPLILRGILVADLKHESPKIATLACGSLAMTAIDCFASLAMTVWRGIAMTQLDGKK